MSLIARELQDVWEALGAGNGQRDEALVEVRIRNLRGIRDLRVPAGPNIGRNTGRNEFARHVRTLGKFGKLKDFILVLDGDSRDLERTLQATAEEYGHHVQPLFLPGHAAPEQWLWDTIGQRRDDYAMRVGLTASDLERAMHDLEQLAAGAVRHRDAAKAAVGALASNLDRTVPDLARIVGQREAEANAIPELLAALTEQINAWRRL